MAMKFWESHAKEMRRARLLNAVATIYSNPVKGWTTKGAVEKALELEAILDKKLSEEHAPKTR